jgi:ABC-type polysaccharide/polyol phosphate export permease
MPLRVISAEADPSEAVRDLLLGLTRYETWWRFAVYDIKQRFRRSVIGPLWITLSMGIFVFALGLVFSTIAQMKIDEILLYIAVGVIFWNLLSTTLTEGSTIFTSNAGQIRNVPIELSIYVYRMLARNVIILAFNMLIYIGGLMIFPPPANLNYLLFIPGAVLFLLNLFWISLVFGILSSRYRDVPQIVATAMQILFIITPVFWSSETLPTRPAFVTLNPAFHLLEIVREPLLGRSPGELSWIVAFAGSVLGGGLAIFLYRRTRSRIAYWM